MSIMNHKHRDAVLEMSKDKTLSLQDIADRLGITRVMVRALQMSATMEVNK